MIRLLAFFAILLGLAFGFSQVADMPGHILLQIGETEIRVSLITGLVGLALLTLVLMVLWSVLRFVFRLPSLIGIANRMRRQAKGQNAVSRGLIAIGAGDERLAGRYARESRKLMGDAPLALLLSAQSAQLSGNTREAEGAFSAMLENPETAVLGLRGLYVEAERKGDRAKARMVAEEAMRRAPEAGWAQASVLGFRAADRDWRGAIAIVDQSVSRRVIDKAAGKAQRAALLAAAALDAQDDNPDEALSLAHDALRADPTLVPAAVLAARRLSARGDYGKASKLIETAWKDLPHPDLAEAYLHIRQGDSTHDRLKRARGLAKLAPDARESRFVIARAALDAQEFSEARQALEALVLQKPTARACLLMAELEDIESNNQGLVRAWLARASRAPRDPAWVADGVVSESWSPVSPLSGTIGGFVWKEPPQADEAHLRARIDADRFTEAAAIAASEAQGGDARLAMDAPNITEASSALATDTQPNAAPAIDIPSTEIPAAEIPAASASVGQKPVAGEIGEISPSPETSPAPRSPVSQDDAPFVPFVPDDPGPQGEPAERKKRFSFFS